MGKRTLKDKNFRLKIIAFMLIVFALITSALPGFDGDGDLTDKLVLVSLGLDYEQGQVVLSGTSLLPKSSSDGSGQVVGLPVSAKGESIARCIAEIEKKTGKTAELGLCGVVVLGDNLSKTGARTLTEVMLSGSLVSPGAFLVQADGSAEDVIRKSSSFSDNSVTVLTQLIKEARKNTGAPTMTLLEFVSDTCGKAKSAHVPILAVEKAEEDNGGSENPGENKSKYQPSPIIETALFLDGKMVGKLSRDASEGLAFTDKHTKKGVLAVENFMLDGEDIGTISGDISGKDYRIGVNFIDGIPYAEVKVTLKLRSVDRGRVNDANQGKNTDAEQEEKAFEDNFAKKAEKLILAAFTESQKLNCDVFEIEQNFYRFRTREYRDFLKKGGKILENVRFSAIVEVQI